jgi:transposase
MFLREQLAEALEHLGQALGRIHELEGQLAKDSHNSSKPPSSDGPRRKRRSQRRTSEKPTGGQPGHAGRSLMQGASPDEVVRHRPVVCDHCHQPLEGIAGQVKERRQVYDLPHLRQVVQEHQVEEVCCPACQQMSRGSFPAPFAARTGPGRRLFVAFEVISPPCDCLGHAMLAALAAVFAGQPLPVAWAPK